jgi:hypothetical protein
MSTIVREFTYTKDSGETSERKCIEISAPRKNYLMLDVTKLSEEELAEVVDAIDFADSARDDIMATVSDLVAWKTFKPEGMV